jgi:glyoxylase-like metal-dependent hydrolase (beta-lactamase superfamily II)
MPFVQIFPQVYVLALGPVNVFLIEDGPHFTLIDTGYERSAQPIVDALRALGKQPSDITNIVVTHCHPDHAGSLATLKELTKAPAWMHRADAEVVRGNTPMVRSTPAPGIINQILFRIFIKGVAAYVPPTRIEHEVHDGDVLPIGGGLQAIHTPGHSAGHVAFLLQRDGGLLFVGDACSNMAGLGYSIVYDDLAEGRRSLAKLATCQPSAICFGHGKLLSGAGVHKFQKKWQA